MLLIFPKCLVTSHSYEGLGYILVTWLESSAVVNHYSPDRFSPGMWQSCVGEWLGCANRRVPFYEAWMGNRWQSEVGKVSYWVYCGLEDLTAVPACPLSPYPYGGPQITWTHPASLSNHRVDAGLPFCAQEGLYLESCSHWLWPGLNTTARHCAQSWRMAQLLWQTFNFSTFCSMTHCSS